MKRGTSGLLSILLALCLAPALPPGTALAADVELSPQKLTADGKNVDCERYNIDGANYFKLRDLAYLLNGTGSQFSVEYDAAASAVRISDHIASLSDGKVSGGRVGYFAAPEY